MSQEVGPYSNYDFLRRSGELHWTGRTWLAVGYETVNDGLKHESLSARRVDLLFSLASDDAKFFDFRETLKSWTFFSDVVDVKAERKFIWDHLGPKSLTQIPELVTSRTSAILSSIDKNRGMNVLENLTKPLRASTVRRFLELESTSDVDFTKALEDSDRIFDFITSSQPLLEEMDQAAASMDRLKAFLANSRLLDSSTIERQKLVNQLALLMVVSIFIEKAIANVFAVFATRKEVWTSVQSGRIDIGVAVKEALRIESPTQVTSRIAREDFEWCGQAIKAGQQVSLVIGSANRDERVFNEPSVFRTDRLDRFPLTFGAGGKRCPGEWLTCTIVEKVIAVFASGKIDFEVAPNGLSWLANPESRRPSKFLIEF